MNFDEKKVLVYGLGKSGRGVCGLLERNKIEYIVFDDDLNLKTEFESKWSENFDDCDLVVISPSISIHSPKILEMRLQGKLVLSEIEFASMFCASEIIAITGTNGKTTTTMLIDWILKKSAESSIATGNIGIPFSCVCDKLKPYETVVLEISSFQLESVNSFRPDIAVLLNIQPDHLLRHQTMNEYVLAKSKIVKNMLKTDLLVYNIDDENICEIAEEFEGRKIPFSMSKKIDGVCIESGIITYLGFPVMEVDEKFCGREIENLLASVAVSMEKKVHPYVIKTAVQKFKKPCHRMEFVEEKFGKKYFNNSKATNVDSTVCAVESMKDKTVLIIGGQKGSEDIEKLLKSIPECVSKIFVVGQNAFDIVKMAMKLEIGNIKTFETLQDALESTKFLLEKNVLFSPSFKSFDAYKNFEERGDNFKKLVRELE